MFSQKYRYGTYVFTSAKNFTVEVNDGVNNTKDFDSVYNTEKKLYEADVTLAMKRGSSNTEATVTMLKEGELSYKTNGNQLIVNGSTVNENTVAAGINASAFRAEVKDENEVVTDEKVEIKDLTATNGHVTYGTGAKDGVTVKIDRNSELTTYYGSQQANNAPTNAKYAELTIKKDGKIWNDFDKVAYGWTAGTKYGTYTDLSATPITNTKGNFTNSTDIFNDDANTDGFFFNAAGKYEITATFYTKASGGGSADQTVTYSFEIDPIKLTAEDVTLQLSGAGDPTPKPVAFTTGKTMEIEIPYESAGEATYTAAVALSDKLTKEGFVKVAAGDEPKTLDAGVKKYFIDGTLTATKTDNKCNVTVKVYDQNYGATGVNGEVEPYEINVSYMLVAAAEKPMVTLVDDPDDVVATAGNPLLTIAEADTDEDTFTDIFWNNFEGNDFVEKNKNDITFEYLPAKGKSYTDDDLNGRNAGFPTKKSDDGYTLFVCYDGEPFYTVDVDVVSMKAVVAPDEAALKMTFGDSIDLENYKLTDTKGNVLKNIKLDDLKIDYIKLADDADYGKNAGKKNGVQPYKDNSGEYVAIGTAVYDSTNQAHAALNLSDIRLNAGTYIIKYKPIREAGADYTVSSDEFILVVEKKQVTADMFYINAKTYTGKTQSVNIANGSADVSFKFEPEAGDVITTVPNFTLTDGQTEGLEVGRYDVSIKLTDLSKSDWKADQGNNFVGTADLKWAITNEENTTSGVNAGFSWADDDTTLFDAGRIHVQYSKKANNKMGLDSKTTVEQYGVIVDNKGLIAAPSDAVLDATNGSSTNYELGKKGNGTDYYDATGSTLMDDAKAKLTLGNGLIEGKASEANQKLNIYGANIKVKDVETGIWARPYILFSDGTVQYGEPIYVDITREAMKNLQVAFNPDKKLDKTKTNAGYDAEANKYVAYAKYEKLDEKKVQAVVRDFGVVVDNKGAFAPNGVSTSNKKDNVIDNLKVGAGFIEGHNNKAKDAVLAQEEYGAKIKSKNSVTGIWVRAYVKLSDTLIVYSDPEYYETVSEYYKGGTTHSAPTTITVDGKAYTTFVAAHNNRVANVTTGDKIATPASAKIAYDNTNNYYTMTFANTVLSSNPNYEFVAMGVVVDKSEKLVKRDTVLVSGQPKTKFSLANDANQQLVLGNGFVEGKKTDGSKANYNGRITPDGNNIIAVRPYVTFKVDGNEVTVYGAIQMQDTTGPAYTG